MYNYSRGYHYLTLHLGYTNTPDWMLSAYVTSRHKFYHSGVGLANLSTPTPTPHRCAISWKCIVFPRSSTGGADL